MLVDRLALMEKELEKQTQVCSGLYREVAINGNKSLESQYHEALEKLTTMRTEVSLVKAMLEGKAWKLL